MMNDHKKTQGRQRIEIKKIEKKSSLHVTFTKRRLGLFKKAAELCILSGAEIAMIVRSPAGKVFVFGDPSVDSVLSRVEVGSGITRSFSSYAKEKSRREYEEAETRLHKEKEMENILIEKEKGQLWWDMELPLEEEMELYELEKYVDALEGLMGNVLQRLEGMEKTPPPVTHDHYEEKSSGVEEGGEETVCGDELEMEEKHFMSTVSFPPVSSSDFGLNMGAIDDQISDDTQYWFSSWPSLF